jgi:hypothetical protein
VRVRNTSTPPVVLLQPLRLRSLDAILWCPNAFGRSCSRDPDCVTALASRAQDRAHVIGGVMAGRQLSTTAVEMALSPVTPNRYYCRALRSYRPAPARRVPRGRISWRSRAMSASGVIASVRTQVIEFGCGPDAFPVTQQRVEIVPQLRQVRRVGAEVTAAQAPEPERASPTASLHVGRLGADAQRDRYLTDRQALVFAFQQHPRLAPHVLPASVELHGRKGIHGAAHPGRGDRLVALSGRRRAMPHKLSQHVDRCAGIGVP